MERGCDPARARTRQARAHSNTSRNSAACACADAAIDAASRVLDASKLSLNFMMTASPQLDERYCLRFFSTLEQDSQAVNVNALYER